MEIIVIADNPDDQTLDLCRSWGHADRIDIVDEKDLGRAREYGIGLASSRWVFLHDGDDLYSSNIYSEFIDRKKKGLIFERRVYHAEFFVKFGGENEIRRMIPSSSASFDPLFLVYDWFYSNKCVIDKSLLDTFPLQHNDTARGLGNEDWSWAGDTISHGVIHDILPDTACFYRVKEQHLSLGLVPSMTQRQSYLYSSDYINSGIRTSNASRHLSDEDDFTTQLPLPEHVYRLMDEQVELEPLISNNRNSNPWAVNSYLRSILRKSADGAAEILGALDNRKKLVFFLREELSHTLPAVAWIMARCQKIYSPRTHQLVIIHETEMEKYSSSKLDDEWGTVYLSTKRISDTFTTPSWFYCRLPLRILVQYPGSTIVDTGTDIFSKLCREYYKIVVSQVKRTFLVRLSLVDDPLDGCTQKFASVTNLLRASKLFSASRLHFVDIFNSSRAWPCSGYKISAGPSLGESIFLDLTLQKPLGRPHSYDWQHLKKQEATGYGHEANAIAVENGGVISQRFIAASLELADALDKEIVCIPQTIQHYDPQANLHYFRWYDFSNLAEVVEELRDRAARGHKVGLAGVVIGSSMVERFTKAGSLWGLLEVLSDAGDLNSVVTLDTDQSGLSLVSTSTEDVEIPASRTEQPVADEGAEETSSRFLLGKYGPVFTGSDYLSSFRSSQSVEQIEQYLGAWHRDRGALLSNTEVASEQLLVHVASDDARRWWQHTWLPTIRYFFASHELQSCEQRAIDDAARHASLLPSAFADLLAILRMRADVFEPPQDLGQIQWRGPENYREEAVLTHLRQMGRSLIGGSFVLLPFLEAGGAELVGTLHLRAWKNLGLEKPRIVLTEGATIVPNYLEFEQDTINLPKIISEVSGRPYPEGFATEDRVALLEAFLSAAEADRIFSVQSYTTSLLLTKRKPARTVELAMFCPHIDDHGRISGFQNMIPAIDKAVDLYISDNTKFANTICQMYGVAPDRMKAISYPPDQKRIASVAGHRFGTQSSRNVLWASRIDHQKNPGLLIQIARAMPDLTFHMYGRKVLNDTVFDIGKLPVNVRFHGEYSSLEQLMIRDYLCFVYTSRFDGMPNILMEIAACGVPVVTPNVGGIADFFGDDWMGFVRRGDVVEDYVSVIRMAGNPRKHEAMINLQNDALRARSVQNFQRAAIGPASPPVAVTNP